MATELTNAQKALQRSNDAFRNLSPEQKRVAIARDVIAQIKAGRFNPTQGEYLDLPSHDDELLVSRDADVGKVLQKVMKNETCDVCAVGAMFVCAVKRANALKVGDLETIEEDERATGTGKQRTVDFSVESDDMFKYLRRFFNQSQLLMIEEAFEGGSTTGSGWTVTEAEGFFDNVEGIEVSDRMRLIMENIIVNNGKFNPKMKPRVTTAGYTE